MRVLNFQFHMASNELRDFVAYAAAAKDAIVTLETRDPEHVSRPLSQTEVVQEWNGMRRVDVVNYYANQKDAESKREPLVINVGRSNHKKLEETQIGGGTRRESVIKLWKWVIRELRKRLPERGFIFSPTFGLRAASATRPVSQRAAKAHRASGLRLALFGSNEVRLSAESDVGCEKVT